VVAGVALILFIAELRRRAKAKGYAEGYAKGMADEQVLRAQGVPIGVTMRVLPGKETVADKEAELRMHAGLPPKKERTN
jgi:hypothetical protein